MNDMFSWNSNYSFGALLTTFRKRKNLTQQHLADAVGVHRNAIGRWEQGNFLPDSKRIVLELVRALQLDNADGSQLLEASFTALVPPWNVPYHRNPFFTGRKEYLDALHQLLTSDQVIAQTQQSYALYGLGGIGKTQLAIEYAYRHALEYTAILWIRAETEETIMASFLRIAELLHLTQSQENYQQPAVANVQRWLIRQSGWLLIWDNVKDMELLHRYLPPTRHGAVLVTTRCQALGALIQGIELSLMEHEEGILFLLRRAKILSQQATSDYLQSFGTQQPAEYAASVELVRLMGCLPLALDQAGTYIEETAGGVVGYLQLYREQYKQLLNRRGTPVEDHPEPLTTTLLLAYKCVERTNVAARDLLYLCAFLHPDSIAEELIVAGAPFLGPTLQSVAVDPYQLDQAIAVLRTYSLINRSSETQTLTIHRLVQVILKEYMGTAAVREWSERALYVLNALFPSGKEVENWPICQRYLAHVEVCAIFIEQRALICPEAGRLLHEAGVYLGMHAQYSQAEQWLSQAHMIRQQIRGAEHMEVAESLNELAILYRSQGKYKEAELLFQRTSTIRERSSGTEHLSVVESLNDLTALNAHEKRQINVRIH